MLELVLFLFFFSFLRLALNAFFSVCHDAAGELEVKVSRFGSAPIAVIRSVDGERASSAHRNEETERECMR